ncbi:MULTISPECIES: aspartate-semialdehyde dehydrogenase [unclassified Streptomyces]|uniref:aspartate-semialdehyde dehydrogenase n=1 Tax=unclassified Streptomyces TaxID=2593676 RepID=UPI0006F83F06|nr:MULTISPECIES: aspartate-semialdehyde dehydrogenase [unclassified Streptomyces]KQX45541.1 aspartate-semialdehyde dehydrogenase [Streptomyces sp. Root1304]KRA79485.1 aspartate-semialdehyde dehydrogenase [Streptomyces sp. Root66D1]
MTPKPTLAVVGATGAVGSVMLQMLTHHADVWGEIRLLASPRSAGRKTAVRGEECEVLALDEDALDGVDVALFLAPDHVAARWAPVAALKGAVVVDTSAAFRADPDVPLVVPETNAHAARVRPRGIVASPGCTTLALIVAVGALHAEFGLCELVVTAQQAASGAGQAGVEALRAQLGLVVGGNDLGTHPGDVRRAVGETTGPFPGPLALNVLPWSGTAGADGASSEEEHVRDETRRILGLPGLRVAATCLRVPVVTGHSVSVHARFERPVPVARAHEILATSPGVVLYDDPGAGDFPTPADVAGTDPAWVGRVRRSMDDERALDFFVCADNLRKGAALNALQIAESVVTSL